MFAVISPFWLDRLILGALNEPLIGALAALIMMVDLAVSDWTCHQYQSHSGSQEHRAVGAYLNVDGGVPRDKADRVEGDVVFKVLDDDLHIRERSYDVAEVDRGDIRPGRKAHGHLERGPHTRPPPWGLRTASAYKRFTR